MLRPIYNYVKKIVPRLSETELLALRSGTVYTDRGIFDGIVVLPDPISKDRLSSYHTQSNSFETYSKLNNKVDDLLNKYGSTRVFPTNSTNDIINDVGKSGLLSLIIDEEYGGNRISTHQSSNLLTKISSVNPALGVVVMVPNSLGPGELLTHYGTQQQKDNYLPKLSDGTLIPCFGLTGPNNGSDLTGIIDKDRLVEKDGKLAINVSLNKRYITLLSMLLLKHCTYGIYSYIQHSRQFRRPLKDMEAVSNKFLDMVFNTWIIQSSIYFTNTLLDEGEKPERLFQQL